MKLTLPQQDVYFEQLLYPKDPIYNIGAKIKIEGNIDIKLFNKAYIELINQHDTFQVYFEKFEEEIIGIKTSKEIEELEFLDFSKNKKPEGEANVFMQKAFLNAFDLNKKDTLPYKFLLIKISDSVYYLFSVYHHIITDGWGTSLMFQRLVKNYNELIENDNIVTKYPFEYNDFVEDDKKYRDSVSYNEDKNYWVNRFNSLPDNLFEKKKQLGALNKSNREECFLLRNEYDALINLASKNKVTTFHVILAALATYFAKRYQKDDIVIGIPVLNRSKAVFKKTVGLFMGIAALRLSINQEDSFVDMLHQIKNQLRKDYRHQRFPIGKLIKELNLFSEKEKLFNITLSYEKQDYADNFKETKTTVIPLTHESERVALAIYIREFDKNSPVKIDFDYNLNYFNNVEIKEYIAHFKKILSSVVKRPNLSIKEISYLTANEENYLLREFNNTVRSYNSRNSFLDEVEKQIINNPDKTAIRDKNSILSYKELGIRSSKIASYLKEETASPIIGVLLSRSVNMIAVLLGILKSGKAYIPLDPSFPKERLQYIVEHSELQFLITENSDQIKDFSNVLGITIEDLLEQAKSINFFTDHKIDSEDTAYIIYTSGSTGNPKGVEIGHKSLLNFLYSMKNSPGITEKDLWYAVTTYSFDISILEFFGSLFSGATLYIANQQTLAEPSAIIEEIEKVNATIIQATPSFFQLLYNSGWKGNKNVKILCGGDVLSLNLAEKILENTKELWNMYGPTETTIWSSIKQIKKPSDAFNVGKPIANTQFYVLDKYNNHLPIDSVGVLHIAGDGLAKGYYQMPLLTEDKFKVDIIKGKRLYNTNDLVKWNRKGELQFIGRNDNQVKIRGYRIELGDIETHLDNIEEVKKAIVISKRNSNNESFLVAYIEESDKKIDIEKVFQELNKVLPKYMIPSYIIPIESFPLTLNKKIDRKELSKKEITISEAKKVANTPIEKQIEEYWKEVLEYSKDIDTSTSFFTIGGHSLNAIKLVHKINKELNYNLSLRFVFENNTIKDQAIFLTSYKPEKEEEISKAEIKELYECTPSQHDIWIASQNKNRSIAYNMSAAFEIIGEISIEKINNAINDLLNENGSLITNFIEKDGKVYQKINENHKFKTVYKETTKDYVDDLINAYVREEFKLDKDLLIKAMLLQIDNSKQLLVFSTHHIMMDGTSIALFIKGFVEKYTQNKKNINRKFPQFQDYSEWLNNKILDKGSNDKFWKQYLEGYHNEPIFDYDEEVLDDSYLGANYYLSLTKEDTDQIKKMLIVQGSTMNIFLMATMHLLIYKITGYNDSIINTVNSGRNHTSLDEVIGMFVKTLPLRININKNNSLEEILDSVKHNMLAIDKEQDLPYIYKKNIHTDVLMVFQNPDFSYKETIEVNDFVIKEYPIELDNNRVSLLFNFFILNDELKLELNYNKIKYHENTIELMIMSFKKLMEELINKPFLSIKELNLDLIIEEKDEIFIDF
ncbi:amino acid adenylation domain-containing protein [Aquimarina rhabdastrellae]